MFSFVDGNRLQDSAEISAIRGDENDEENWKGDDQVNGVSDEKMMERFVDSSEMVDGGNVYSDKGLSEMGDYNQQGEMEMEDFGQRAAVEMGDVGQRRAVSEEWEDFGINGEIGKSDSGLFEAIEEEERGVEK